MLAVWFFLAGAFGSGPETDLVEPEGDIVSLATDPAFCNLARASSVALTDLARNYRQHSGECVAVRGWWTGRALFASAEDAEIPGAYRIERVAGHRLGIYGDDSTLAAARREPRQVTAVGLVSDCERFEGGIHGYCHSVPRGGFLILGEVHPAGR